MKIKILIQIPPDINMMIIIIFRYLLYIQYTLKSLKRGSRDIYYK